MRSLISGAGFQIICVLQSMNALVILRGRVLSLSILDWLQGLNALVIPEVAGAQTIGLLQGLDVFVFSGGWCSDYSYLCAAEPGCASFSRGQVFRLFVCYRAWMRLSSRGAGVQIFCDVTSASSTLSRSWWRPVRTWLYCIL